LFFFFPDSRDSLFALEQAHEMRAANITHVLTVIDWQLAPGALEPPLEHLVIDVEDDEDEDLLRFFGESNRFIQDGLERRGGAVFVHW
jgi:dual specificity phosphatase 12